MTVFCKENYVKSLRISLKGAVQFKALIPANWDFFQLKEYLQGTFATFSFPLICRNHHIFDSEALRNGLGQTFDCHFVEDKRIYRLKIEKVVHVNEDELLPLILT